MARSSASLLIALAAGALLAKNMGLDFVGMRPSVRSSSVAMRAEEGEEVEEKVIAEGDRLRLKVQSAEGDAIREAASEVILPSASGQLGILANHAPMMSALDVGVLRYKQDSPSPWNWTLRPLGAPDTEISCVCVCVCFLLFLVLVCPLVESFCPARMASGRPWWSWVASPPWTPISSRSSATTSRHMGGEAHCACVHSG